MPLWSATVLALQRMSKGCHPCDQLPALRSCLWSLQPVLRLLLWLLCMMVLVTNSASCRFSWSPAAASQALAVVVLLGIAIHALQMPQ